MLSEDVHMAQMEELWRQIESTKYVISVAVRGTLYGIAVSLWRTLQGLRRAQASGVPRRTKLQLLEEMFDTTIIK